MDCQTLQFTRTSKLFLEVTKESQNVFIEIMALPICQTSFKVHVPFDINNLMVHGTFKPTLTVSWSNFAVQNLTTNQIVSVPHEIPISIFMAIKLHKILQQPYHVFVYQTHHGYTITPLRQNKFLDQDIFLTPPRYHPQFNISFLYM